MKKMTKVVLSLILTLALVVLPVAGNTASFNAAEADAPTQGKISAANMYDWNGSQFYDFLVFMSLDEVNTVGTMTGQQPGVFVWQVGALLEFDAAKNAWVVTKADLACDGVFDLETEALGEGKMVLMYHPNVETNEKESFDFYAANLVEGKELYLGVDPSALYDVYDYVDGAYLSTTPVDVEEPEADDNASDDSAKDDSAADDKDADKEAGMNPVVIAVIVVAVIAVVGVVAVVVSKRKKAE
jgi:hypothetical protein